MRMKLKGSKEVWDVDSPSTLSIFYAWIFLYLIYNIYFFLLMTHNPFEWLQIYSVYAGACQSYFKSILYD